MVSQQDSFPIQHFQTRPSDAPFQDVNDEDSEVGSVEESRAEEVRALVCLHSLLQGAGCVSSSALRKELEANGLTSPRELVVKLRYLDSEDDIWSVLPVGGFTYRHHKRSFYTEHAFEVLNRRTHQEAERAGVTELGSEANEKPPVKRRRQEEARLVTYIESALEEIYSIDDDANRSVAFDVHNDRPGSDFENVDLIAIQWRSGDQVDLVSVEAKLDFTAKLVQQANNYRRFSDLVWIACPIDGDLGQAAAQLRDKNPRLFDYVVECGLGILACKRRRGNCYEVAPVHWPRRNQVDPVERLEFVARHQATFVEAGVVPPADVNGYPRLI